MDLDFTSLHNAIQSLESALRIYDSYISSKDKDLEVARVLKAGVVQNFEFTYELSWKFMMRWIEVNRQSTLGITRRELYRYAAENGLIDDVAKWADYNEARNTTSHTYDEEKADFILAKAYTFKDDAIALYNQFTEPK